MLTADITKGCIIRPMNMCPCFPLSVLPDTDLDYSNFHNKCQTSNFNALIVRACFGVWSVA